MPKIKNPLFSFGAVRALGKHLTFRRRGGQTILEKTPIPQDAKSLPQLEWRHMYQKAVALWHALSADEKNEWESLARPKHMTGFAWFMSQCLRPNPGIYLPLQGGTMSGAIDMAKHRLLKLPEPVDDQEAARKMDLAQGPPAADYPMILKPAITRYVCPGWFYYGTAYSAITAGVIYYRPIFVTETTTYIGICIYVHEGAAGIADLRIFNWNDGLPGSLLLSAGTVNTGTTGNKEIAISQQLTRGYYFLAVRTTGTPGLRTPDPERCISPPLPGLYTVPIGFFAEVILTVTAEYADPAPPPTDAALPNYAYPYLKEA